MPLRTGVSMFVWVVLAAALAACGGNNGRRPDPSNNGPALVPAEYETTKVGRRYVDQKIVVTKIDRSGFADGAVSFTIRNRTDEFLTDLAYEVTLYYKNVDASPDEREFTPYVPATTSKRRIDLDGKEEATLTVKPEDLKSGANAALLRVLKRGASDVLLRLWKEGPEATAVDATFLGERLRVSKVERKFFSDPATVTFTLRNEWEGPLRLQYKILLIKDDAVVKETEWRRAPGIVEPGATISLEGSFKQSDAVGTNAALKVKRPRI